MYREMRPDYQSDTAAMVKVAALRAAGLTLRQIAAQVGISHPSVLRLLAAANIVT
jgi:DNA-binding transcriptional regulator LsrR (DeoR family)